MTDTKETKQLLTALQVAIRLNISKPFAYKLMASGDLPSVKIGSARRVRPQDLEKYIEDNLVNAGLIRR